jgi:isopenicillin N synthase-like dioxygenase
MTVTADAFTESDFARSARDLPRKPLPVIDVGRARRGDGDAIEDVARQWREVWETLGFLCIVNHGLPPVKIGGMTEAAKRFHDLPLETKMSVAVTHDQKGYVPARGGLTTHSKFHKSKKLNTVECLVLATDYPADDPNVVAGKRFYGHTPWLPEDVLPGFRATCEDYMATITALGKSLLPVWARSLELEADFFKPFFECSYTYFRVAKYPPKNDLDEGEMGSNAHCDTGFNTYLRSSSIWACFSSAGPTSASGRRRTVSCRRARTTAIPSPASSIRASTRWARACRPAQMPATRRGFRPRPTGSFSTGI